MTLLAVRQQWRHPGEGEQQWFVVSPQLERRGVFRGLGSTFKVAVNFGQLAVQTGPCPGGDIL